MPQLHNKHKINQHKLSTVTVYAEMKIHVHSATGVKLAPQLATGPDQSSSAFRLANQRVSLTHILVCHVTSSSHKKADTQIHTHAVYVGTMQNA